MRQKKQSKIKEKIFSENLTWADISRLYAKVETLEQRVQDIEDYILRRRRGGLFSSTRR